MIRSQCRSKLIYL